MMFSTRLKTLLRLLKTGQLIVSGGGITVRQLPSGEYELSLSSGDLQGNAGRTAGGRSAGGDPGKGRGGFPGDVTPPTVPGSGSSGSYRGHGGRTIDGVGGADLY